MEFPKSVRKVPEYALKSAAQETFSYNIEIVGTCNLRCPSCPVGNMGPSGRPNGLMDPVVFENILKKIATESPGKSRRVAVFDWGEPTLHPDLPRLIELIHQYGFRSRVSTNLNLGIHLDPIVKANPHEFHISLSGYYQPNYSQTHAEGNVERVKDNIRLLSRLKTQYDTRTAFLIGFHAYRHNLQRDLPAMRRLADEVGFDIQPAVAQLYPFEKRLAYLAQHDGEKANVSGIEITTKDRELIELLLVKPEHDSALRQQPAKSRRGQDCGRRSGRCQFAWTEAYPYAVRPTTVASRPRRTFSKRHTTRFSCSATITTSAGACGMGCTSRRSESGSGWQRRQSGSLALPDWPVGS